MKIVINTGGQSYGPYSVAEVRGLMDSGKFHGNDFAWSDKLKSWATINDVLDADNPEPLLPLLDLSNGFKSPAERVNIPFPDNGVVVNSDGQNFGPYTLVELRGFINSGKFKQNDLAWSDQEKDWFTIAEFLAPPQAISAQGGMGAGNSRYPSMAATPAPAAQAKNIMINSGGQNYGPYTPDQVREFVRWGIFQMNDFAWSETTNAWLSVVELLHGAGMSQPQLQPMQPMPMMSMMAMQPQFQMHMQPQYPMMPQPPRPKKQARSVPPSKAKIIIISGGQKFGPYTPGHAHEFLRSGKFHENDFAWSDAHNGWLTLGEVLDELRPYARKGGKPPSVAPMSVAGPQAAMMSSPAPMMGGYTQIPIIAPMQIAPAMGGGYGFVRNPVEEVMNKPYIERNPIAPKRRASAASVMAATAKNFGPSF